MGINCGKHVYQQVGQARWDPRGAAAGCAVLAARRAARIALCAINSHVDPGRYCWPGTDLFYAWKDLAWLASRAAVARKSRYHGRLLG